MKNGCIFALEASRTAIKKLLNQSLRCPTSLSVGFFIISIKNIGLGNPEKRNVLSTNFF